jgi:hypothetical protein
MSKTTFNSDNKKPFKNNSEVETTKKPEKISTENIIETIRSDMNLVSDTSPEKNNFIQRINLKLLFGILLTLFIIVLAWFMLGGPGRPILEHNLAVLVQENATSTQQIAPTAMPPTATPAPSSTPVPSPTFHPTHTPTAKAAASPTTRFPTPSPTAISACRDVLSITLTDVGQTICVQGIIIQTIDRPNAFMVIFSEKTGSLYWVSYDMVWSKAELDTCYQTTGTIKQLGSRPILLFGYNNIPEKCK